jgi:hypothetical protein
MKKVCLGIAVILLTLSVGVWITKGIKSYFLFSDLQDEVRVTWQDEESSCGKPRRVFTNSEPTIIDNPLCNYSPDLREVPTISFSELEQNKNFYDDKIVRVQGRFFSEPEDPFQSRLYIFSNGSIVGQHVGAGYWNFNISEKLCKFIDLNAPDTNAADVTLIIKFIDASDNPSAVEFNHGSPFLMTILDVEEMHTVLPVSMTKPNKKRQHKTGHCWNDNNRSYAIYD